MDNKCLKMSVYVNENILCETLEQPVDVDFILPDYCPDISKIFKCKATVRINSKGINGKNATVDGNVCITLMYCDGDDNICSYEYMYPFNKIKELPEECDNCNIIASVKCDYINCRALTGRKVDIHGAATINLRIFKRKTNDIVSDYEDNNIQLKRHIAPATVPMGYREKYIIVEEEIGLANAQADILGIIRHDAIPMITECKVISDKIVVKGEMAVSILYMIENVKLPQIIKTTIPFSQIVDMTGVNEMCKCDTKAEMASVEIKPGVSMGSDNRCFALNAKILLKCESYCVNEIPVLEDAFSTKFATNVTKEKLTFSTICDNIKEKCHCKKNIELSENIGSVIDMWCEGQSKKVKFENGKMNIMAAFLVGMVVCDQDDKILFFEKTVDFEYSYPIKCESENLYCEPEIEVNSVGYTITSANSLEIRVEALINAAIYENRTMSLITDLSVDQKQTIAKNCKGGMVICFVDDNQTIWDIARKYNASIEEIMKINHIENNDLGVRKTLLVPII